ncbi:probable tubulin polyglutamylase TTLL2 isoform X1 [Cimex lectularius]|uniref:Tubulin polyglutamylase TTLL2 n=3 Tax=Cimex lectularius TaxID=79782 RepID=A0A8I6RTM3_CIMLE|nr:probable tubulin polyglutamylase TTLL2 isoform X1 [Cimex lectularius]
MKVVRLPLGARQQIAQDLFSSANLTNGESLDHLYDRMIEKPFIFKINDNGTGPNLLHQVFLERGWQEFTEATCTKERWNIWWRTTGFPVSHYKALKGWQFTNHVPKASAICKKDYLSRYLRCMKNNYGFIFDFSPEAFILPNDYSKLVETCNKLDDIWICKPVGQSQGKGISIFRKISELTFDSHTVVQRYVRDPFLIGGYKFDLRLYVCVPCFHPLTIYLYREGLARFSTDKFSLSDLKNRYAHLTNSSVNKQGPGYSEMKDKVGAGCKWTLKQLRHYLKQNEIDDWLLWQRIVNMIVLTVASQVSGVPTTPNCFEFYGFDVLIDQDLKPWLLEVNSSPALCTDCDVDPAVKKPMLHDMFDLLGLPICNTGLSLFCERDVSGDEASDEESDLRILQRTATNAATVVAMAQKWKKHVSLPLEGSKSHPSLMKRDCKNKRLRSSCSTLSLSQSSQKKLPKRKTALSTCIVGAYTGNDGRYGFKYDIIDDLVKKEKSKTKWDNGIDWKYPTSSAGHWVRVYPFRQGIPEPRKSKACTSLIAQNQNGTNGTMKAENISKNVDKEIKNIVTQVTKYYKTARDSFIKNKTLNDCAKDSYLVSQTKICEDVWHPLL